MFNYCCLTRADKLQELVNLAELYVRSPHLAIGYIGDETVPKKFSY